MGAGSVRGLLEPVVSSLGLDLEDVDVTTAGRRRRVCVVIDRDGGIDLDTIAEVSRAVSDVLDSTNALGDAPYVLEVTSPGVDRPLTLARHWQRARGRLVACVLRDGSSIGGRVVECDGSSVTIDTASGPWRGELSDITKARVEIEFTRPEAEGE